MRGRARVGEAATLIDRDVHQHATRLHLRNQVVGHQLRRLRAGDQNGTDDQVGSPHSPLDGVAVGRHSADLAVEVAVNFAELVDVGVEQFDIGTHAQRNACGVESGDATADHHDPRRVHAGNPTGQHAAPTAGTHQRVGAHLRGEAPGDLTHRRKQRQTAVGHLHRLVCDTGDPGLQHRVGQLGRSGQVQVGEQHLVPAHARVFLGDRFLDLEDQLALRPHLLGGGQHLRASREVVLVRDRRSRAGVRFDENLVSTGGQLMHTSGCDRDPVFVVLDLARHCDLHGGMSFRSCCA